MQTVNCVKRALKALNKKKEISIGFCFRQEENSENLLRSLVQDHPEFSELIAPMLFPQISPTNPDCSEIPLGDLDFVLKGKNVVATIEVMEVFYGSVVPETNPVTITIQQFKLFCELVNDFACFTIDDEPINY